MACCFNHLNGLRYQIPTLTLSRHVTVRYRGHSVWPGGPESGLLRGGCHLGGNLGMVPIWPGR